MSVIPIASDIYAEWRGERVVVVDVRADGDAQRQDIARGDVIVSVNDESPAASIAKLLGRDKKVKAPC